MPRALWTGTINFGLVNIPVRLYPATRRKDVRFHEIDRVTGGRVRHQRVRMPEAVDWFAQSGRAGAPAEPQPRVERPASEAGSPTPDVRYDEVLKGYEVAPDQFVTFSREEIEELRPQKTRTIEIEEFVDSSAIEPVHFDTTYHLAPQHEYERPFALLVRALEQEGKLAICWIVLRHKRHLASLRPLHGHLLLSTMFFADEVLPLDEFAPRPAEEPSDRELKMAALLLTAMSGDYDPARYEDGHRKRLLALIESRSGDAKPASGPAESPARTGVEDLMSALEASLKQIAENRAGGAAKRSPRSRRRGAA